jgi:hypothetical protein
MICSRDLPPDERGRWYPVWKQETFGAMAKEEKISFILEQVTFTALDLEI